MKKYVDLQYKRFIGRMSEACDGVLLSLGYRPIYSMDPQNCQRDGGTTSCDCVYFKRLDTRIVGLVAVIVFGGRDFSSRIEVSAFKVPAQIPDSELNDFFLQARSLSSSGLFPTYSVWSQGEIRDGPFGFFSRQVKVPELTESNAVYMIKAVTSTLENRLETKLRNLSSSPIAEIEGNPAIRIRRFASKVPWILKWTVPAEVRRNREDWTDGK